MQTSLQPAVAHGVTAGASDRLLLAVLPNAAGLAPNELSLRQQREDEDRRRLAREELDGSPTAVGAARDPVQVVQDAERRLDPSSRAWRRRQANLERRDNVAQDRRVFRRALADASSRRSGAGPRGTDSTPKPAPEGKPQPGTPKAAASQESKPNSSSPPDRAAASKAPASADPQRPAVKLAPAADASRPEPSAAESTAKPAVQTAGAIPESASDRSSTGRNAVSQSLQVARAAGAASARPVESVATAVPASRSQTAPRPATKATARPAREAESGKNDANVERILRSIRKQIGKQRSTATIRLEPARLGTLRLHMDLRNQELSLRVETQTALAHRLLLDHVQSLREGLELAGLRLERIEVRPPPAAGGPQEASPESTAPDDPTAQPDPRDAGDDRSAGESPESAGGGRERGTESHTDGPLEHEAGSANLEPAAESLVNILA
ncbi:MAG: flagellar hook-length control protein FliK [Planctomycetes bacterium]|nr:flagellar hook-length control protein FliK [Planctomycetota bacterium]